jgi:hypothetical protein
MNELQTNRPGLVASAPSSETLDTSAPNHRLRALTGEIEEFLLQQIRRLESLLGNHARNSSSTAELQDLLVEVEHQQRQFDVRREEQMARIQLESARLTDAWQRLENEQRELLAQRQRGPVKTPETPPAAPAANSSSGIVQSGQAQPSAADVAVDHELPCPETTAFEFQQLRREIQRHIRRNC